MYAYDFHQGDGDNKDLLGGKGAGLARMTQLGLPVPPGFTVSTQACRSFLTIGGMPPGLWDEILDAVHRLEMRSGRTFGEDLGTPLLLSVRSGAKFSMPGMMDTVLNLGINDEVVTRLADWAGDEKFAWDAYRRFVQMFGKVVLGVPGDAFEEVLSELRSSTGAEDDSQLSAGTLRSATRRFQQIVIERSGEGIPEAAVDQLHAAVVAVFRSWNNARAQSYRRLHNINDDLGTAVNVQMMVFGDIGDDSGTGVCFTRDPGTGENVPYGDYLPNAQGEDVVAGIRNTLTLDDLGRRHPEHYTHLLKVMRSLERHYRDMCDLEFTIEKSKLWILQTRVGKRTAKAAVTIANDMVEEHLIDRKEAVLRVDPASLDQLLHPHLPDDLEARPLARGVAASPGAATGQVVFDADTAVAWASEGRRCVLVRRDTTPDDIMGMAAATGILTSHGGKTSHAAVVARGMGRPAVTGADVMTVDEANGTFSVGDTVVSQGDEITIDGSSGRVYLGSLPLVEPTPIPQLEHLLAWADAYRRLGVRANADTPEDAARARAWGAAGIGLARTEHMFMGDRLPIVQRLILSDDDAVRKGALDELRAVQVDDFEGLLEAMDGLPVIVRLLDPPLHEFLPDRWVLQSRRDAMVAAGEPTDEIETLMRQVERWEEVNPMLGLRGVRLGLTMPDIYLMQVRAALDAVLRRLGAGGEPRLEIMVPLVSTVEELFRTRTAIEAEIESVQRQAGRELEVLIGTMIETPRAALTAGELARAADFFSFGTNDLTQMTFGFSRDDAEASFLVRYVEEEVLPYDPFASIDVDGVGRLVRMATHDGKVGNPRLEAGICGEHGGDPETIAFCHNSGLDYVSCSPPRVPAARLAAAQAAIGGASTSSSV